MDISSEKAIEFNDWLEQKWSKEITKCSSWNKWKNGGRILKIWKAGNTENYKENFTNKILLVSKPHDTSACQYSQFVSRKHIWTV